MLKFLRKGEGGAEAGSGSSGAGGAGGGQGGQPGGPGGGGSGQGATTGRFLLRINVKCHSSTHTALVHISNQ